MADQVELLKLNSSMEPDENGLLYKKITTSGGALIYEAVSEEMTQTIRLDENTVQDIVLQFDIETGEYVEKSRTDRAEPEPVSEIEQLRQENQALKASVDATQSAVMALMDILNT